MCSLESFTIDFKGLGEGVTLLEYDLDDTYFKATDSNEIRSGEVHVDVSIRKVSGFYELSFHLEGIVNIPCDLCLEDMGQPVCADNMLTVKLGEEYSEDDNLVTIDENDGTLNVAWLIYEFVALQIPLRHVHKDGECNPDMLQALEEHSAVRQDGDGEDGSLVDPRWSKLLNLKNKEFKE